MSVEATKSPPPALSGQPDQRLNRQVIARILATDREGVHFVETVSTLDEARIQSMRARPSVGGR
jgi:ABC-type polar amino acid transport system ATPase subunit